MAGELIPKLFDAARQCRIRRGASGRARVYDNIDGGQPMHVCAERFPEHAFDAIAIDGVADGLCCNRQAEPRVRQRVRADDQQEIAVAEATSFAIQQIEFGFVTKSVSWSEAGRSRSRELGHRRVTGSPGSAPGRSVIRRGACGLWRGVERAPGGRHESPCERGIRACACDANCWVDMCAS